MHPHPAEVLRDGTRHRFHAAWVSGFLRGGLHCCSIYLKDSEGASETNMHLLHEAATFLSCLKGPWIIGVRQRRRGTAPRFFQFWKIWEEQAHPAGSDGAIDCDASKCQAQPVGKQLDEIV